MTSGPSLPSPPPPPLPEPTAASPPPSQQGEVGPTHTSQTIDRASSELMSHEFFDPVAAFLSYLIPGLGQVYQGRIGKGILFFIGLYGLFFYGMSMGQWRNVWLPDATELPEVEFLFNYRLNGVPKALSYRPQFAMQFCIGTAAWPAIAQYMTYDREQKAGRIFGSFERAPTEDELNDLQRSRDTRFDLGWVYTVIAGALNLLVIYDALAGPMIRETSRSSTAKNDSEK